MRNSYETVQSRYGSGKYHIDLCKYAVLRRSGCLYPGVSSNAIDACNTRAALEWSWGTEFLEMEEARALNSMRNPYSPQISIQYNSETQRLVFEDNGIGINARDIEQYVAKIGVSFIRARIFYTAASL